MARHTWILTAFLLVPVAACGGGDSPVAEEAAAAAQTAEPQGVSASGNGWTATFPGEVEVQSDPVPLPGGQGTTTAESTTWESSSEAVTVMTSDLPPALAEQIDARTLLDGTATSNGGTVADDATVLDPDGNFRGRPAVVYQASQGELTTTGLAFLDGARLYQVLHVTRDAGTASWEALVDSLELTG